MLEDKKKSNLVNKIRYILGPIIVILIFKHFFPYFRVISESMEPTIKKNAYAITSRYAYKKNTIKRGDIVVFKPNSRTFNQGVWMHRIIGVEDDRVKIEYGLVYVNNELAQFENVIHDKKIVIVVPKGFVFQKGDSNNTIYGLVPMNDIIGKVIWHN